MQACSRVSASSPAVAKRSSSKLVVRAQAVSEPSTSFKLPTKAPLPKDAAGVKAMIAKSHEIHGQGRSMWFSLSGAGKRASAGTYLAHADTIDWQSISSGSMDSYNIYS
ncbi:hypothetical protein HYH02_012117 [Chlamydomonas schloesseri]|uniref:Uncharacterized protein n=1 Tax=Chlamydomonas schloesseri TaxID=2026947 RepID=A0A835SXC3_9CHLO|nr:hypothetical protein HYH02_012117 [Chlamydomonas schloesseri]|eukprot:KAG2434919.1 hypothetical protein HYH02_012117 [Chlamydomonas schloesseri]